MKVRALIALAVLASVAALFGSAGPGNSSSSNGSTSTSTQPGFFRGR